MELSNKYGFTFTVQSTGHSFYLWNDKCHILNDYEEHNWSGYFDDDPFLKFDVVNGVKIQLFDNDLISLKNHKEQVQQYKAKYKAFNLNDLRSFRDEYNLQAQSYNNTISQLQEMLSNAFKVFYFYCDAELNNPIFIDQIRLIYPLFINAHCSESQFEQRWSNKPFDDTIPKEIINSVKAAVLYYNHELSAIYPKLVDLYFKLLSLNQLIKSLIDKPIQSDAGQFISDKNENNSSIYKQAINIAMVNTSRDDHKRVQKREFLELYVKYYNLSQDDIYGKEAGIVRDIIGISKNQITVSKNAIHKWLEHYWEALERQK